MLCERWKEDVRSVDDQAAAHMANTLFEAAWQLSEMGFSLSYIASALHTVRYVLKSETLTVRLQSDRPDPTNLKVRPMPQQH